MESCKYCSTDENSIDYHEIIECITCALDAKDPYTSRTFPACERHDAAGMPDHGI